MTILSIQELSALDNDTRRSFILANLSKYAPLKPLDAHLKWEYERNSNHVFVGHDFRDESRYVLRPFLVGEDQRRITEGHSGRSQTCEACWQARATVYRHNSANA